MSASIIVGGLGLAVIGFGTRYVIKAIPKMGEQMAQAMKSVPKLEKKTFANSRYYKGGFDTNMSKKEAALILGVSPNAPPKTAKAAYQRLILINHPDKGGSPYISAKISEAKDYFKK